MATCRRPPHHFTPHNFASGALPRGGGGVTGVSLRAGLLAAQAWQVELVMDVSGSDTDYGMNMKGAFAASSYQWSIVRILGTTKPYE